MDVSIIIPLYKPDEKILKELILSLNHQKFIGKKEIIMIDSGKGLSAQLNDGTARARYPLIVSLQQDCIPHGKNWLSELTKPFKNKKVVASVSRVVLPESIWNSLSIFTQALMIREKGTIQPALDEKGCAYRKEILQNISGFDEETFRTAGEDLDMYLRISKKGTITYPRCEIIHYHPTSFFKRLSKTKQYANGNAANLCKHGVSFPGSWKIILRGLPIIGLLLSLIRFPFIKFPLHFLAYLLISPIDHFMYLRGFWKGMILRKQTV